jgi:putative peptide zinc metalloprotease protein
MKKLLALVAANRRIAYVVAAVVVVLAMSGGVLAETGTLSATTSPTPSASAPASDTTASSSATPGLPQAAGGAVNIVQVSNSTDNSVAGRGKDQVSEIGGPNVAPQNVALAYSSCVNCQTLALALQIVLVKSSPSNFQPHNAAAAVNYGCTNCVTCAIALQQVVQVSDPTVVPPEVRQEAAQVHKEVADIRSAVASSGYDYNCPGIVQWATNVLQSQMSAIAATDFKHDIQTAPTTPGATPLPSSSASPSATVSGSPTESSSPTATPSASASSSP